MEIKNIIFNTDKGKLVIDIKNPIIESKHIIKQLEELDFVKKVVEKKTKKSIIKISPTYNLYIHNYIKLSITPKKGNVPPTIMVTIHLESNDFETDDEYFKDIISFTIDNDEVVNFTDFISLMKLSYTFDKTESIKEDEEFSCLSYELAVKDKENWKFTIDICKNTSRYYDVVRYCDVEDKEDIDTSDEDRFDYFYDSNVDNVIEDFLNGKDELTNGKSKLRFEDDDPEDEDTRLVRSKITDVDRYIALTLKELED